MQKLGRVVLLIFLALPFGVSASTIQVTGNFSRPTITPPSINTDFAIPNDQDFQVPAFGSRPDLPNRPVASPPIIVIGKYNPTPSDPTPEPASVALLMSGLMGAGVLRRIRRSAH